MLFPISSASSLRPAVTSTARYCDRQGRTMKLRALIVDDELLARTALMRLLKRERDISIIGQCGDGGSAVETIRQTRPDLVFLDVQMPEMDGFQVVEAVGTEHMPVTIFVTAFDRYAIRAFDPTPSTIC